MQQSQIICKQTLDRQTMTFEESDDAATAFDSIQQKLQSASESKGSRVRNTGTRSIEKQLLTQRSCAHDCRHFLNFMAGNCVDQYALHVE